MFLGAMVLKLGKANVVGTFIGALVLSALTSGLTMIGSVFAVGQVIKGLLLIMGVAVVTMYRRKIVPTGQLDGRDGKLRRGTEHHPRPDDIQYRGLGNYG